MRTEDVVGRWGGEEFIILAPQTDLPGAMLLGERARLADLNEPFDLGDRSICVTVSIGCTSGSIAPAALVKLADLALYRSKTEGRNRVTAEPPPS